MTNREKLENMINKKFAGFLDTITTCCATDNCEDCPLKNVNGLTYCCTGDGIEEWLESEVEDD